MATADAARGPPRRRRAPRRPRRAGHRRRRRARPGRPGRDRRRLLPTTRRRRRRPHRRRAAAALGRGGRATRRRRSCGPGVRVRRAGTSPPSTAAVRRVARRPGPGVGRRPRSRPRPRSRRRASPTCSTPARSPAELDEPIGADGHLRPEWSRGRGRRRPSASPAGPSWRWPSADASRRSSTALAERPRARGDGAVRVGGRAAVRRAGGRRPAGRPGGGRGAHRRRRRAAAAHRRRGGRAARAAATPRCCATRRPARTFDLRSPGQVRSLLRRVGVEVPDTRAWRLEPLRDAHPLVERAADVAQGRAGRHDLRLRLARRARRRRRPAARRVVGLRRRGRADDGDRPGCTTCPPTCAAGGRRRAGPRVRPRRPRPDRAAGARRGVGRRARWRAATSTDDMYAPVAAQLGVDRADGQGRRARRDVRPDDRPRRPGAAPARRRPTRWRWRYLHDADRAGQVGRDAAHLRRPPGPHGSDQRQRRTTRARRPRRAPRPGAATAATRWCRARRPSCSRCGRSRCGPAAAPLDARIVLCLHDELLVHVPVERRRRRRRARRRLPQEAADRWAPGRLGALRRRRQRRRTAGPTPSG